nr:reverse transcriptase domain-containing protein [Tanacetum cinerariifolium]
RIVKLSDEPEDQGNNQANQNDNVINDNIRGDVRDIIMINDRGCCTYKESLACNPKEYDGKGGATIYTRWIEKMEASHATYTDRFYELAGLVPRLVTSENKKIERYVYGLAPYIHRMVAAMEPTTIQGVALKAGVLINEAIRNRPLKKKNTKKRGNGMGAE